MAAKDNANPIIHRPIVSSTKASTSSDDWWRDDAVHVPEETYKFRHDNDSGVDLSMDVDDMGEQREEIDADEVFDLIRSVTDPEHPITLEELAVVNAAHITVTKPDEQTGGPRYPHVNLEFTPTIPHCSMATLIGLSLRVRLLHALPPAYKVDISIRPGTHQSENAINKQLNDKERVAAALENEHLLGVVRGCLESSARRGKTEEEWARKADELAKELGVAT